MKTSKNITRLCAMMAIFAVTACGIKPQDVEPPQDGAENTFPRTYPDISTDPKANEK